ncbi:MULTISPECIES: DUF1232 domain-containing protein [Paraburkholderia]|nr:MULTISPECIES: YkvA family protein [Paraburkholderia]
MRNFSHWKRWHISPVDLIPDFIPVLDI